MAVFYLPEPPKDFAPLRDFRRLRDAKEEPISADLAFHIRSAYDRRELALEMFQELNSEPARFVVNGKDYSQGGKAFTLIHELCHVLVGESALSNGAGDDPALKPADKLDRAFRNAADALATAERLKARKIDLIVADMGSEPVTQNGVSRMFFGMLALVAEFERERIRERSAEGRAAKRQNGGHIGGSAPFGFRKVGTGRAARLELDPVQQAALSDIRKLAAKGLASRAIAAAVQARHGLAVTHVTVLAALARETG